MSSSSTNGFLYPGGSFGSAKSAEVNEPRLWSACGLCDDAAPRTFGWLARYYPPNWRPCSESGEKSGRIQSRAQTGMSRTFVRKGSWPLTSVRVQISRGALRKIRTMWWPEGEARRDSMS